MKKFILSASLLLSMNAMAVELECFVQVLYPRNGCGNCQAIDRRFILKESSNQSETVNLADLKADGAAGQRTIYFNVMNEGGRFVHADAKITNNKTKEFSVSSLSYQDARKGIVLNVNDASGVWFTVGCR